MSGLTDEQRKRVEENRLKALALRAKRQGQQTTAFAPPRRAPARTFASPSSSSSSSSLWSSLSSSSPPSLTTVLSSPSSVLKSSTVSSRSSVTIASSAGLGKLLSRTSTSGKFSHSSSWPIRQTGLPRSSKSDNSSSVQSWPVRQMFKANCRLMTRSRFCVECKFHAGLVQIFKGLPSRIYDAKKCEWSFLLSDHGALVEAVRKTIPDVELDSIPSSVISRFLRAPPPTTSPPDLLCLDSTLLEGLFPFQKEGVRFGISRQGRVLIADEMGLGKTVQAVALAVYYRREWPLIVVCPSSVRYMWSKAFQQWVSTLSEDDINVVRSGKDSLSGSLITIVSYDLLRSFSHLGVLQKMRFQVIICDESHFIKNRNTIRCKVVSPLIKSAARAILLSGTPALSRPVELYTQVFALDHRLFPSFHQFGVRYCAAQKTNFGWDYSGNSNLNELQLLLEDSVMLRRLKKDVLDQLPAKLRQLVLLDPSTLDTRNTGRKVDKLASYVSEGKVGLPDHSVLMELFADTAKAKIEAVKSYVLDLLEGRDRKIVIFGHHQVMLDALSQTFKSKHILSIRIDGKTPSDSRHILCDRFQKDPSCLAAVLSITAAGVGLTLNAASVVVFAELFWNPGILIQAEDRVHRIGQEHSVTIHYLVAQRTADDQIWPLIARKLDILGQVGLSLGSFAHCDTTHIKAKDKTQPSLFQCWSNVSIAEMVDNALAAEDCSESVVVPEDESDEELFCDGDIDNDRLAPAAKKPRIA